MSLSFFVGNASGGRVIRKEDERYNDNHIVKATKFGSGPVMLWGCFYPGGYGPLVALDGKVDPNKYDECLEENYLPWISDVLKKEEGSFILQEDGASSHTGKKPKGWKEAQPEINSFNFWPAQSADLNPIEHIWAYLEKRIEDRRRHISNSEQLRACIHEEWKKLLDLGLTQRLVPSMPRRCQTVIAARGGATRYCKFWL